MGPELEPWLEVSESIDPMGDGLRGISWSYSGNIGGGGSSTGEYWERELAHCNTLALLKSCSTGVGKCGDVGPSPRSRIPYIISISAVFLAASCRVDSSGSPE